MLRMNSTDVVDAYKATGLIPVRKAWMTQDARGGCAFDAVARHLAHCPGEAWADAHFDSGYIRGFVEAWDADQPVILEETGNDKEFLIGYWDAILCREAVEKEFTSVDVYSSETA